uniref:Uncharacterized protein n=1 Tax=Hyaloperonospora arabidopsidis (strain Emoy2) TaxID=559515 RepID=M4BK34_HYAAE
MAACAPHRTRSARPPKQQRVARKNPPVLVTAPSYAAAREVCPRLPLQFQLPRGCIPAEDHRIDLVIGGVAGAASPAA